ncbi:MAG TPA: sensor histidine kinase [Lacibacter sp.]|nr:sensor histidine kinase [Lacibacter sp.]
MLRYLLLFVVVCSQLVAKAHEDTTFSSVATSKIKNALYVTPYIHVYIDTFRKQEATSLRNGMFKHLYDIKNGEVRKKYMIDGHLYLLLWITNDLPETKTYYFTAGSLSKDIHLYTRPVSDSPWVTLPYELPGDGELSYSKLVLESSKEVQLLVRTNYARTTISLLKPYLVDERFYKYHVSYQHTHWYGMHIITYTISGILLMMILFSFFTYVQNRRLQFLYYSVYALCVAVMLFLKAVFYNSSEAFNFFNEEYLDYALLITGYIFYIGFTRKFLNTPNDYKLLNKIFVTAEIILFIFLALFSWMYFTDKPFVWLDTTENMSKYFMIFLGLVYVVIGITQRNKLMNYLLAGNLANLLFAAVSQTIIVIRVASFIPTTGLFRQSLLYFEIGIFLELVFFLLGLIYKNKIELIEKVQMDAVIKQEQERQEYEKEIAVLRAQQDERTRISADMHDELGSGVTAIRLLSEIALQKTKEQPVDEIARISNNANELMSKMNGIIWSMNPGNDTLGSSISYMRANASEYLDNFKINYTIHVPETIPAIELSGNRRRNLFLVMKESLNNIVKHANAGNVTIDFNCTEGLNITIQDDGKGINPEKLNEFGNGLKNMQRRMENIGGSFTISSSGGTKIQLHLPLIS